jgi:hypothetical protein
MIVVGMVYVITKQEVVFVILVIKDINVKYLYVQMIAVVMGNVF